MAVLVALTGCAPLSPEPAPRGDTAPSQRGPVDPTGTGAGAPGEIVLPPVSEEEVARVVAEGVPLHVESTSGTASARGVEYAFEAACVAGSDDSAVAYRLLLEGRTVSTGTIACDGERYRNTGLVGTGRPDGDAGGGAVLVLLDDLPPDVTLAFARLVATED